MDPIPIAVWQIQCMLFAMKLPCILVGKPKPGVEARLADAGMRAELSSLDHWMRWLGSAAYPEREEPLLVICGRTFEDPAWTRVRVRLAEAGRFFLAAVQQDGGSAAIVEALREGAYEAVSLADPAKRWAEAAASTAAAQKLWRGLFGWDSQVPSDGLVGRSAQIQQLREQIQRIGPTRATVLILGESGTGKERVAQALHAAAPDAKDKPFVAINCTALPRELMEGELFGVVKGAYTGAGADRPGLVETADGGTLFLDEIGDLDPALQPKLLRFLETRKARRLGGKAEYSVDIRIISATNADLARRIAAERFREDLYYRIADFTLELAPLRQRAGDIPLLCRHFLHDSAERHGRLVGSMEPALLEKLQAWSWPGNIRELRSTIDRLVLLSNGTVLSASAWEPPARKVETPAAPPDTRAVTGTEASPSFEPTGFSRLNKRQRRETALRLLEQSGGDQAWVSSQLGIHPSTLYRWRVAAGKA
jgi:DNA-binding NtrC family response regulator